MRGYLQVAEVGNQIPTSTLLGPSANTYLTTANKIAQRILSVQGVPRALTKRTPLHVVRLDVDAKMAKHEGRGTPIHNAIALKEGRAGHQGIR